MEFEEIAQRIKIDEIKILEGKILARVCIDLVDPAKN